MVLYNMNKTCRLHSCEQCAVQLTACPLMTGVSCCQSQCLALECQGDLRAAQWFDCIYQQQQHKHCENKV